MKFYGIRAAGALTLCLVLLCSSIPVPAQETGAESTKATETSDAAKVNLNSATAEQLKSIPGIGDVTAKLILEYRTKAGKFSRVEELMNIKGIGEKKFQSIKDLVTL